MFDKALKKIRKNSVYVQVQVYTFQHSDPFFPLIGNLAGPPNTLNMGSLNLKYLGDIKSINSSDLVQEAFSLMDRLSQANQHLSDVNGWIC